MPGPAALGLAAAPETGPAGFASVAASHQVGGAPRGIAATEDRVFITDPAGPTVSIIGTDGARVGTLDVPNGGFVEPVDVAIATSGEVVMLDSGKGSLEVFDAGGVHLRTLTPTLPIGRSRGLAAAYPDGIWVAATSLGRLIHVGLDGTVLAEIEFPEGAQPVDVVARADGTLYVVEASTWELLRAAADGSILTRTQLNPAETVHGPHLAIGAIGTLFITDPEFGFVHRIDADGAIVESIFVRAGGGDSRPLGVALGEAGHIWVSDTGGRLLSVEVGN